MHHLIHMGGSTIMNDTMYIAEKFGVVDKIQKLESDLLLIPHITKVEFDLNGFLDNISEVIFLLKNDIPAYSESYFDEKSKLIDSVLKIAGQNGLSRTGDRIEDYGNHYLYFVTKCDNSWESCAEEEEFSPGM